MKAFSSLLVLVSVSGPTVSGREPLSPESRGGAGVTKLHPYGTSLTKMVTQPLSLDTDKKFTLPNKWVLSMGALLAFNSGFLNGACLFGGITPTKQAVSAVTGAYTTSAVNLASGSYELFKKQGAMILSYMGGSCLASLINPEPVPFLLKANPASLGFAVASMLLVGSYRLMDAGKDTLWIFSLIAMANGLQNSITSVHSGNLIRSAHFSGLTSDLGTFLGQFLRGNTANLFKLKTAIMLCACFYAGGYTSYFGVQEYAGQTLLFSAGLYALIALGVFALQY